MKHTPKHWIAAGLLTAVATMAGAQTQPPSADSARMQQRIVQMQQHRAQRLGDFKQKLQLSPGQEGAWNSYVAALNPSGTFKPHDRSELSRLTTPERIDRMRALRAERIAKMDQRDEATKSFYAVLTAEQKKVFDDATARRGGHHHGGHRGHHSQG